MKRIFIFLSLMLAVYQTASAYDFYTITDTITDGTEEYYIPMFFNIISETEVEVTHSGQTDSYGGTVTIPSSVEYDGTTYAVTGIGQEAFSQCSSLTEVIIPNSVTSIGLAAFFMSSINSITLPSSINHIEDGYFFNEKGYYAMCFGTFSECTQLSSVTFECDLTEIGDFMFFNCSSLDTITLPETVTSIGNAAFQFCGLKNIVLPKSLEEIHGGGSYDGDLVYGHSDIEAFGTFAHCQLESVVFECDNLNYLPSHMFYGCYPLDSVSLPDNLQYLDGFENSGIRQIVIPESVTIVNGFTDCKYLSSVIFEGNNVKEYIASFAFAGCASLTDIKLPEAGSIEEFAFKGCPLKKIIIPATIEELAFGAFAECYSLKDVYCMAVTPPWMYTINDGPECPPFEYYWYTNDDENHNFPLEANLYVPEEAIEAYKLAICWGRGYTIDDDRFEDGKKCLYFNNIYPMPDNVGVKQVEADAPFTLYTQDRCIFIDGASSDAQFEVYDLTGRRLYSGTDRRIPVPQAGAYIVRGCGVTQKVMVM